MPGARFAAILLVDFLAADFLVVLFAAATFFFPFVVFFAFLAMIVLPIGAADFPMHPRQSNRIAQAVLELYVCLLNCSAPLNDPVRRLVNGPGSSRSGHSRGASTIAPFHEPKGGYFFRLMAIFQVEISAGWRATLEPAVLFGAVASVGEDRGTGTITPGSLGGMRDRATALAFANWLASICRRYWLRLLRFAFGGCGTLPADLRQRQPRWHHGLGGRAPRKPCHLHRSHPERQRVRALDKAAERFERRHRLQCDRNLFGVTAR